MCIATRKVIKNRIIPRSIHTLVIIYQTSGKQNLGSKQYFRAGSFYYVALSHAVFNSVNNVLCDIVCVVSANVDKVIMISFLMHLSIVRVRAVIGVCSQKLGLGW